jgi:hypothetical protein
MALQMAGQNVDALMANIRKNEAESSDDDVLQYDEDQDGERVQEVDSDDEPIVNGHKKNEPVAARKPKRDRAPEPPGGPAEVPKRRRARKADRANQIEELTNLTKAVSQQVQALANVVQTTQRKIETQRAYPVKPLKYNWSTTSGKVAQLDAIHVALSGENWDQYGMTKFEPFV